MELFLIMGNKLIYYNVGISFLENYHFNRKSILCVDNIEFAHGINNNKDNYTLELLALGEVFNISNPIHLKTLYNSLEANVEFNGHQIPKEIFICFLNANWSKDSNEVNIVDETEETLNYYTPEVVNILKINNYSGYIALSNGFSTYTIFNPNKNVKVKKIIY